MRVVSSVPHIAFIGLSQTLPRQQDMTGCGPRKGNNMKKTLISLSTLALAGGVSLGVLGLNASAFADDSGTDAYVKREEKTSSLALAADDNDDDDTNTRTRTRTGAGDNTGNSKSRADNTNSRVTGVSRDQDRSRGDLTRDWTRDGGDLTRDLTADLTNDKSRNDTRG